MIGAGSLIRSRVHCIRHELTSNLSLTMASEGTNMNLNVHLRTDAPPEQLVKELLLSPLIYIRLAGIVSSSAFLYNSWES